MRDAIDSTGLNLGDMTMLTEAATGAYGVTPIIAALAGARHVYGFARSTHHGTVAEAADWTNALASEAGVADRVSVIDSIAPDVLKRVDIVTNSGHLRPITCDIIDNLPPRAVIALMFEAWEFRPADIDVTACRRRGIPIVGVNEHHAAVDVFSYLGPLCAKLLHDAGVPVYENKIAVICDNGFDEPIIRGLSGLGASVHHVVRIDELKADSWDAIVIALQPSSSPRVGPTESAQLAAISTPGTIVVQFWGDVDRAALQADDLQVWPPSPPLARAHGNFTLGDRT